MSLKIAGAVLVFLGIAQPVFAQSALPSRTPQLSQADYTASSAHQFDASVANLTVQAAFSPQATLSRQQILSLMLLMSVPRDSVAARDSMNGATK